MTSPTVTIDDLRRILREGAGTDEAVDLGGEILDARFADLGYDSLALLETASRAGREYGIAFDDEAAITAETPRLLLDVLNAGASG